MFAEYGFRISWGCYMSDDALIMVLIKADRGVADRKEPRTLQQPLHE